MQFWTKLQEKLLVLNVNLPEGLKWIFSILIKTCTTFSSLHFFDHHHLPHFFSFFHFFFELQFSFLDYFFIWRPIYNPSAPMTDPLHRLQGDSSRKSDPPLRAPHFSQNHIGFNEGEPVLPLSRLHLHRSSQAGNEIGFFWISLFYSAIFSIYL